MEGTPPLFAAVVLTGGASRRMRRPKALLELDGVPMAVRTARAAEAAGATAVACVGLAVPGLAHVPDDDPGAGPLAALGTALAWCPAPILLALACDLVVPDPAPMRRAVLGFGRSEAVGAGRAGGRAPDVVVPVVGGRSQHLHAAWRVATAAPAVHAALAAGERSVAAVLARLAVHRYVEPAAVALADADDPHELARALRLASSPVQVPEVTVAELAEAREGGAPLIDVRQPDEWEEFRAPGAVLLPLGELPDRLAEVPAAGTVYVICRSGGRSAKAVEVLRAAGVDAVNVAGGSLAWRDAGYPVDAGPA